MSSPLLMMEAALFQLRAALPRLDGETMEVQVRIAAEVLASAVAAAREGLNPARVGDIEFALSDLEGLADTLTTDALAAPLQMLRSDLAMLREAATIDPQIVERIRALQAKLKERAKAMERNQYRAEETPEAPLPHDPESLRDDAIPLVRQLAAAGFETPALDQLVADPESVRYHTLREINDELDVIAG